MTKRDFQGYFIIDQASSANQIVCFVLHLPTYYVNTPYRDLDTILAQYADLYA